MKYLRLTKEQFEALYNEFALFLASQQITSQEWSVIKKEKPYLAEEELDIFSDYVWDNILEKVEYADKIDKNTLFLFRFGKEKINVIIIKTTLNCDFQTSKGLEFLFENIATEDFQVFKSSKTYSTDKKNDIFELIKQGSQISDGKLYKHFAQLLNI